MRRIFGFVVAGLLLAGCQSTIDSLDGDLTTAQKGLAAAHLAHAAAADALVVAATAMPETARAVAKSYLDQSEVILGEADSASDAATMVADTVSATNLINEAKAVIP
jgi:hypothetical protein